MKWISFSLNGIRDVRELGGTSAPDGEDETIDSMGYRTSTFPYGSRRRRAAQRVGLIYNDDGTWGLAHFMTTRGQRKTWRERGAVPPKDARN